jgi:hypothetical protein
VRAVSFVVTGDAQRVYKLATRHGKARSVPRREGRAAGNARRRVGSAVRAIMGSAFDARSSAAWPGRC